MVFLVILLILLILFIIVKTIPKNVKIIFIGIFCCFIIVFIALKIFITKIIDYGIIEVTSCIWCKEYYKDIDGSTIIKSYNEFKRFLDKQKIDVIFAEESPFLNLGKEKYLEMFNEDYFKNKDLIVFIHPSTYIISEMFIYNNILYMMKYYTSVSCSTKIFFIEVNKDSIKEIKIKDCNKDFLYKIYDYKLF